MASRWAQGVCMQQNRKKKPKKKRSERPFADPIDRQHPRFISRSNGNNENASRNYIKSGTVLGGKNDVFAQFCFLSARKKKPKQKILERDSPFADPIDRRTPKS